jgi:hypothetical protein
VGTGGMMGGGTYGGMMNGRGFGGMMGGMMNGRGFGGMMGGYRAPAPNSSGSACPFTNDSNAKQTASRLSMDEARTRLEDYLAGDDTLQVAEIMEFQNNFYAVILEKDTGRGAMELLVDPYSGQVSPEYGPNMMWNEKYGHMGSWYAPGTGSLTLDEARTLAQSALDEQIPAAEVEGMGIEFYGYFTFDYTVNGQNAGMLSVRNDGQSGVHTWHGDFLSEVELD